MRQVYYYISFPEIQEYQKYEGFDDNSVPTEDAAYFVDKDWADDVDNGNVPLAE